jgi:hypothetical protein
MKLTDLDGIGPKTAEKLREKGIGSPSELGEAYEQNRRKVRTAGSRVRSAARSYLYEEEGGFTDPYTGAEIDESNRAAFEKLATREVSDFNSVSVQGSNPKVSPDDEVRKFVEPVREGTFNTEVGGDSVLMEFAADTAQNLGVDDLSSGELQDVNRANEEFSDEVELREQSSSGSTTTARGSVGVGDLVRAQATHARRSPEARRVDNNRSAERTRDYEEWASSPDSHDFPGVDTPGGVDRFFPEERTTRKRGGFGSTSRTNRDREQVESAIETANQLNEEQQERVFGEAYGSVPNLFGGDR